MNPFSACFFLPLLAFANGALTEGRDSLSKWEAFKNLHGKTHSRGADASRMKNFLERDAMIEAHNARFAEGLVSFSLKHNEYSDRSGEEMARFGGGFIPLNATGIPTLTTMPAGDLPPAFNWKDQGMVTGVKNQDQCGACYAFAGAGALESLLLIKAGVKYDLSEQDVVDCNRQTGGCNGGNQQGVYGYLNQKDVITEQEYPYYSGKTQSPGTCRIAQRARNVLGSRLKYSCVMLQDETQLAQLLMQYGPLFLGVASGDAQAGDIAFNNFAGGQIFDDNSYTSKPTQHAVLLVGFGTDPSTRKQFWEMKNSYGVTWGAQGYMKFARGKNMLNILGTPQCFLYGL